MKLKLKLIASLFALFTITNLNAQHKSNFKTKIDSVITAQNLISFNGVILISKNDKVIYTKAVGYKNIEDKIPLKLDDQFEIMSNTKQITSVLLLKEVEKGRVNLNDPIKKYIPTLTQNWADSVTVHQLLNHTHGIVALDKPLLFTPGTDFKYGNLSNVLLGKIIENSTKKSYREVANELFKELKMTNTFCYVADGTHNLTTGYINDKNRFEPTKNELINEENLPADGVISTANDLLIWNNFLHNGKILSNKMYKLMTTASAQSQHNVFGKEKQGYGYNIRIAQENNVNYLGHTGLGNGFSSLNIYIPKNGISIIVLENNMSNDNQLYYYYETMIKNIVLKSISDKKF
ncbi:D-alanyl-D-alanine carboxypeptidase precursor [Algoriella xinjiangensis]|uniref:serine hydrolase domain-containing protein n=1 Tax=Algoriella xinjiangensis TaxID=684065 RepID=UPI000F63CBFC|nr:serine hydrolase domain-containing protein [Algoriella xinjiangensis]VDH15708.1 D-alanyl-D-alanine carboxypeptidase precursor [Algoriella xinjiangensis]